MIKVWLCLGLCLGCIDLPAAAKLNADGQGLALHGYDPVAYVRLGKALKGRPQLDARYGGATFLFTADSSRALFQKNPRAYLPAYGGWCAVGMASGHYRDVDPRTFKVLSGTTHLFYHGILGNKLKKWEADEATFKASADAYWKKLNEVPVP